MKNLRNITLLIFMLTSFQSFAEIREVLSMREVAKYITPGTLVIFDLDNTVLEANQTLGTDQFFSYLVKKAEAAGIRGQAAKDLALQQASDIQPITKVRLVEKLTLDFVKNLQKKNYAVFALTSRPPSWSNGTLKQVASLGLDFSKTAPRILAINSNDPKNGSYQQGIFFLTPGSEKGPSLINFLNDSAQNPEKIIFIDDKIGNVQSVDAALTAAQISNLEFRYGAADNRVKSFDPVLADFEYNYFLHFHIFLNDQVAQWMMKNPN